MSFLSFASPRFLFLCVCLSEEISGHHFLTATKDKMESGHSKARAAEGKFPAFPQPCFVLASALHQMAGCVYAINLYFIILLPFQILYLKVGIALHKEASLPVSWLLSTDCCCLPCHSNNRCCFSVQLGSRTPTKMSCSIATREKKST